MNTLGDVRISDGRRPTASPLERTVPVVEVKGVPTDPVDGHFEPDHGVGHRRTSLFDALGRWASRKYSLVPRETQYPPGRSTDEVREQNAAQMSGSELTAQAAALRQLNRPTR